VQHCSRYASQCSTVVRNTGVKTTIKVNGKLQIFGTRSPQTTESIDLKFDSGDYVGGATSSRSITLCPSKMISAVLDVWLGRPYTLV